MVSQDKIDEIWNSDLLERQAEAAYLIEYTQAIGQEAPRSTERGSFVMNVKGRWGTGKTFFLNKIAQQLQLSGHKVAHLDAWKADDKIDPLISLISAIKTELKDDLKRESSIGKAYGALSKHGARIIGEATRGIATRTVKHFLGESVDAIGDIVSETPTELLGIDEDEMGKALAIVKAGTGDAFDKLPRELVITSAFAQEIKKATQQRDALEAFCKSLRDIVEAYREQRDTPLPLYVIVDELDRCRPTFAIQLLERINHLFDVEGIVFLIGTDSDELEHSIRAVYGESFNSHAYLNRFFVATYHLATPSIRNWVTHLIKVYGIELGKFRTISDDDSDKIEIACNICGGFNMSIRDCSRVFFMLKSIQLRWKHRADIDLVSILSMAIIIFQKGEDYLQKISSFDHRSTNFVYQTAAKIEIPTRPLKEHDPGMVTLHTYMERAMKLSEERLEKILRKLAKEPSTDRLSIYFEQLLKTQILGRNREDFQSELSLISQYPDLLKTASQLQLPESETD